MTTGPCPPRERLAQFGVGRLAAVAAEGIAEHVANCRACESALAESVDQDDPFVRQIQLAAATADDAYDAVDCATVISRFKAVCPSSLGLRAAGATDDVGAEPLPEAIGQYRVLGLLGRGGMGSVYFAAHPLLMRNVAIKVLRSTRDRDPALRSRFRREMAAVGQLQHPHIVQAYDADERDGLLFLVMEYIDGTSAAELVSHGGPLYVADACEIVRQAALALDHAHRRGMVHRDVKPSNLMLSRQGVAKLVDLGLAALADDSSSAADLTRSHIVLGTCDFMAPEQWADPRRADGRADIYSLGCTLYYLLTGRPPFADDQYDTPAKKLLAHASAAAPPPGLQRADIGEAVEAVVLRMLEKQPAGRYATAAEVAEALASHCGGANLTRLVARHGAASTPPSAASRRSGSTAASAALAVLDDTNRVTVREPSIAHRAPAPRSKAGRARRAWIAAGIALVVAAGAALAIAPWSGPAKGTLVVEADNPDVRVELRIAGREGTTTVDASPGKTIDLDVGEYELSLAAEQAGTIRLERNRITLAPGSREVVRIVASRDPARPDAAPLASASASPTPAASNPPSANSVRRKPVPAVRVAHEASRIPAGSPLSPAALVSEPPELPEVVSWTVETRLPRSAVHAVGFSPDGTRLASGEECGTIRVWTYPELSVTRILIGHAGSVNAVAWSPDSRYLASAGSDGTVRLWDVDAGAMVRNFVGHTGRVACVRWSPDGETIASGGDDMAVRLWHPASGMAGKVLTGHDARVTSIGWSPTVNVLASGQKQRCLVLLWNPQSGQSLSRFKVDAGEVWTTEWSPDGHTLAIGNGGQTVWLWDVALGERRGVLLGQGGNLTSVAWSSDGERLAAASWGPWLHVWDVATRSIVHTLVRTPGSNGDAVFSVDWLRDAEVIVSGEQMAGVRLWNAADGQPVRQLVAGVRLRSTTGSAERTPRSVVEAVAGIFVTPQGHFDAPPGTEDELVYVALTAGGQEVFDAAAFARRFGWTNEAAAAP